MYSLVNHKNGTIEVKDIIGKVVCTCCKGFRTNWNLRYWNQIALRNGGLYSISTQSPCIQCHGEGFWDADKNLINFEISKL